MKQGAMNSKVKSLPYVNNLLAISVTAVLAVASVFIFFDMGTVGVDQIYIDAAIFGFLTFVIDTAIIYPQMRKRYRNGELPENPLISKVMLHTPRNPFVFAGLFGILFALVVPAFNYLFLLFYGFDSMEFWPFLFYRTVYAVAFSMWMARIIILRYVQEGAFKGNIQQKGSQEVVRAFPQPKTLKQEYDSVLTDFGLNMLLGLVFGGTKVGMDLGLGVGEEHWIMIMPQYRSGLLISVIIYTGIVFFLAVVPVIKNIKEMCEAGEAPPVKAPGFFKKLPYNHWKYACVWIIPFFLIAYVFLYVIMKVMGFEVLNFFQFWLLRLLLIKLIVKVTVMVAVLRYAKGESDGKTI